ncbi:tetratricopeptide repeat protein [Clostridioides sp. ES-S-0049-02]|uniref:tetratricopeptide repeat protein n=1 Tax=Clostridioides sp. ES-S-0049-02 TaxID=2770778 RepID=UPI001D1253A1|nr:tetratricopeptide repeat protein [Clostridioides sp. ES-S-0049-02]
MSESNIGKNIKKYRLLKGWTQEQLASESGLSKNAIYNYENGKRNPNIKFLSQIADALEIDYENILDYQEISKETTNQLKKQIESAALEEKILDLTERSILSAQKSISINPNDARAYCLLASSYSLVDKYKESIETYQKAIDIDSECIEAHEGLGNVYTILKRYEDAIEEFSKILSINNEYLDAYRKRGKAYENMGLYDSAMNDYSIYMRKKNNHSESTTATSYSKIIKSEASNNIEENNKLFKKSSLLDELYSKSQKLNNDELEAIVNIVNVFNKQKEEDN